MNFQSFIFLEDFDCGIGFLFLRLILLDCNSEKNAVEVFIAGLDSDLETWRGKNHIKVKL